MSYWDKLSGKDKLVVVEGITDRAYILQILDEHNISGIFVDTFEGDGNIGSYLEGLASSSQSIESLGIIVDADEDYQSSLQSVRTHLDNNDYPYPDNAGDVVDGTNIRCGVFIWPDNGSDGELENLILRSLSDTDTKECIDLLIDCCKAREIVVEKEAKSLVMCYLSIHNPIKKDIRKASADNVFPVDNEHTDDVVEFLRSL